MKDRIFYPLALLAAAAMVALALVWPQGLGAVSPAPFGHAMGPPPAPEPDKAALAKAASKALAGPTMSAARKAAPKLRPEIESDQPSGSDKP